MGVQNNEKLNYIIDPKDKDRLSGLYNRRAGEQRLIDFLAYAKDMDITFVAVMADINDLSIINETYGHDQGDHVIQRVAAQVMKVLHASDFAVRLSGDEFFIVFTDRTKEEVLRLMDAIVCQLEKDSEDLPYKMGFCYGFLEIHPQDNKTSKKVIMETDDEMYQWKRRYHLEKSRKAYEDKPYRESDEVKSFIYDKDLLLSSLINSSEDYIYVCNMRDDPTTFRYPKNMVDEFGLPGEIVHDAANVWGSHVHEEDMVAFLEANQEIADGRVDFHNVKYRARNKKGQWVWLRCQGHVERDIDGKPVLFSGFITDLSKKNKIDPLTGLFNKYEMEDTIQQMVAKGQSFSMMLLDLDEFGNINKLYNQHIGDAVLHEIAILIQKYLPSNAKLFRNDGDEFYIIIPEEQPVDMNELYVAIQKELDHQHELEGKKYHCTVSAGCVRYPDDAADGLAVVKAVGYALETSKRVGKNRLTFFKKEMLQKEIYELDLIEQLRYSVEHDFEGFELYFQPQVLAEDGKVIGAEALARWQCDMYGNVPPLTFIPLLEKSGMIIVVGKWIFEEALKQCKKWIAIQPDYKISINLSYLQVLEPGFVGYMDAALKKYGVSPKNIIVEMTESCLVKSNDDIKQIFEDIRNIGIRIAMDDFGTGYSSLGVLKNSPADIVKIDKIFIKDILVSDFDATFIRFVVSLCHDVGIYVLLEGVETIEEYNKVKEMGLDYIQGYFFGKPMQKEAIESLLLS